MSRIDSRLAALLALVLPACGGGGSGGPTTPSASPTASAAPAGSARFTIDSAASRHPISPYIYGMNQPNWASRSRGLRLARLGGNRWTAYNWETNASNAGADYRHQNDDYLGGGDVPGEAVRPHVAAAHAAGASMVVTVPMAGYVSADKSPSGDVNQTPDYLNVRFLESRAAKRRGFSYPPDTGDRVVYQDEFVAWLESAFPDARRDPARTLFYSLDNEPDLWASTHPRIRPTGKVTYAELVQRTEEYAGAIKAVAPGALVFGPVSYGWQGFVRLQDAPDAGGRDFLDFYLDAMRDAEGRARRRLVDVLDLHWYPEARGGGVRITEANNTAAVAEARVQAPRSLWDPGYTENSWISIDARVGAIRLLPRMREKIAAHYPGTLLAITEYNYGGGDHVSGGVAQADVLGIFGREDVFAATLWDLSGGDGLRGRRLRPLLQLRRRGRALRRHLGRRHHLEPRDDVGLRQRGRGPGRPDGARRRQQVHGADHGRDPGHAPRGLRPRPDLADRRELRDPGPRPRPRADRPQRLPARDAGLQRDDGRPQPLITAARRFRKDLSRS